MIETIILLIFNSLFIVGLYKSMDYEIDENGKPCNRMILWFIPHYTKWLPEVIQTPLYNCIKCMASIHGFYIFWYFYPFELKFVLLYIFYTFALTGLNSINEQYINS